MREASTYRQQALHAAWQAVQEKLELVKKKLGIELVQLERVFVDADSSLSRIDELPDEPKSAHADHVEVRVGLEVQYRIVR